MSVLECPICGGLIKDGDGFETPPFYCDVCSTGWNSPAELIRGRNHSHNINPIVVRDCEDMLFPDTWALDLDGKTIAYVYGEEMGSLLSALFNPLNDDPLQLLDVVILLMRTGTALARDFERLRAETGR